MLNFQHSEIAKYLALGPKLNVKNAVKWPKLALDERPITALDITCSHLPNEKLVIWFIFCITWFGHRNLIENLRFELNVDFEKLHPNHVQILNFKSLIIFSFSTKNNLFKSFKPIQKTKMVCFKFVIFLNPTCIDFSSNVVFLNPWISKFPTLENSYLVYLRRN